MPIAKHAVQLLQVVQGSPGGLDHTAAFITEDVLFQVKVFACGGHELPHACRFGGRHGFRVERRLNERQQGQFSRHVAPL